MIRICVCGSTLINNLKEIKTFHINQRVFKLMQTSPYNKKQHVMCCFCVTKVIDYASSSTTSSLGIASIIANLFEPLKPVPAGISLPMITFSIRPARLS